MSLLFTLLLVGYAVGFGLLAWKNFRIAVALFIITLPTYLLRFKIGPLPSTVLELALGMIWLVWLIRYARTDWRPIRETIKAHRVFFIFAGIFFVASLLGVAVSDMVLLSLGQWRAYFLEPMMVFFVLVGRTVTPTSVPPLIGGGDNKQHPPLRGEGRGVGFEHSTITTHDLIFFLLLSTISISIYCLFQWFTGWGIATAEWTALATRRVTAFFMSPNAVGLYLGPILILGLGVLMAHGKNVRKHVKSFESFFYNIFVKNKEAAFTLMLGGIIGLAGIAMVFTKSEGTVVAVGAGVATLLFLVGYRKLVIAGVLVALLASVIIPPLRSAIFFADKAGQNRLTLWGYSWEFLSASPKNFVFGAGVRQFFRKVQKPHYDVKKMERLIYPHNIALNFWTETGILGMISFLGMLCCLLFIAYRVYSKQDKIFGAALLAMLVTIVVHGLVDVPYFKNDLAMEFWVLVSLFFISSVQTTVAHKKV